MRVVEVDLDNAGDVQRLVDRLRRRYDLEHIDAPLREALRRTIDHALRLKRLSEAQAAEIRAALDEVPPAAVLASYDRELIEDRPALGAFPRSDFMPAPDVDQWFHDDPRRLKGVLHEAACFGDVGRAVEAAVDLAERLGIAEEVYVPILKAAARGLPVRRGHHVAS